MSVYLLATLDTKGAEAAFIRERLKQLGLVVRVVDCGCLGQATVKADISRDEVFRAAGTTLESMQQQGDRGQAVASAAEGAAAIVARARAEGELGGVIALGGSAGTTIGTTAMRALPLGVPKVMVSTLASGQVRPYVRDKDLLMLNSVVDIAGLNRISRQILGNAASAIAGLVQYHLPECEADRPLVAATMFGVTTPCVQKAREILEQSGYEVLVFHATGNGGQAMESLIRDGLIEGVLDLTTTELADELVGGILSAGPDRLTAAAAMGTPQVVSVGALDMVNFGPREDVPARFQGRHFHIHNPTVTLMRTTADENRQLGHQLAEKLTACRGPACILLPQQGVSALDDQTQPFEDPQAREALFSAIRTRCQQAPELEVIDVDAHINDEYFATTAAKKLIALMKQTAAP